MAKKFLLVLVLAAIVAGGAFAEISLSAGGGGYFTGDLGAGVMAVRPFAETLLENPYFGGGGFIFFDATYAELSLGFIGFGGAWDLGGVKADISGTGLDIGLLLKYPFHLGKFSIFPALGINYRIILSQKAKMGALTEKDEKPGDSNALWINLGGGLDFSFTEKIYFRGEVLYGMRTTNKVEDGIASSYNALGPYFKTEKPLGGGFNIKLAVGYKF